MAIRNFITAISRVMLGSVAITGVFLGTVQVWANELVVVLPNSSNLTLKTVIETASPGAWANAGLRKRVVVPVGVEIKATVNAYAILATVQADGLAGSWAGELTLEVRGTVSGIGGVANSGVGGSVINVNFTGRNGEKLKYNLIGGTSRAGGGGGGKGGNGGQGVWYSGRTVVEGPVYDGSYYGWFVEAGYSRSSLNWGGHLGNVGVNDTSASIGGYVYRRSTLVEYNSDFNTYKYRIDRYYTVYDVPNYTAGGVSGNGGRGQGCDGAAAAGSGPVAGGTNAGASGACGAGGAYGSSGTAGSNGTTGNYTGGTAGAAAGLAGFHLTGAANCDFVNTGGTALGRVA